MLRASGNAVTSSRCGGRIASMNLSAGMLRASVFPEGILLEPLFMSPMAILKHEVNGLAVTKGIFGSRYLQINHASRDAFSPVVLYASPDSPLARAIESVTGITFSLSSV